jgi:hypothetical protein
LFTDYFQSSPLALAVVGPFEIPHSAFANRPTTEN